MADKSEKQIQIPESLFVDFCKYIMLDAPDPEVRNRCIRGIESKLDAIATRNAYTISKTANSEEAREKARLEYLDRKGIPQSFRW